MLWFSIPAVIFLASIPLLLVTYMTIEFSITVPKIMSLFSFVVACVAAYNGFWIGMLSNIVAMVFCEIIDECCNDLEKPYFSIIKA